MYEVAIVFTDGSKVEFYAQEFNIDLDPGKLPGDARSVYQRVQKFTYKDYNNADAPIYLKPSEVAGIVVAATGSAKQGLTTK